MDMSENDSKCEGSITTIGIMGAGFMGSGIATAAADKGLRVLLSDPNKEALGAAKRKAWLFFKNQAARKKINEFEIDQRLAQISLGTSPTGFSACSIVIESVYEKLDLKRHILKEFEEHNINRQIFASNTSAIPIKDIGMFAKYPERIVGMHFFSPAEKMPLLEIIKTSKTADWVTYYATIFGNKLGKKIIVVNDGPGFYTTRILAMYLLEALFILSEGASIEAIDHSMVRYGFPVGPLTLIDEVGIDVCLDILRTMHSAFPDRFALPKHFVEIAALDRMGKKNGKGFYSYKNSKKTSTDRSIYSLVRPVGNPIKTFTKDEISRRCMLVFTNEAIRCLDDGIIQHPY